MRTDRRARRLSARRRARRLLRTYPRAWRERYGEEFVELLIADIEERPRSWSRTLDIVRVGARTRAAQAGLMTDESVRAGTRLAAFGCAAAAFLAFATGVWSQLTIGWQWSAPDAPVIAVALPVMSLALGALLTIGAAALGPIVWCAIRARRARLVVPAVLTMTATAVLIVGTIDIAHGWPGTGGRQWQGKGLIPPGLASFGWAATLSITSYWAHPQALGTFPASQIAWMAIGPLAIATTLAGAVTIVRRIELSPRTLRYEAILAKTATGAMLAFLTGALAWMLAANPGPRGLFRYGAIDIVDVAVMAAAVVAARRVSGRITPSGTSAASPACG